MDEELNIDVKALGRVVRGAVRKYIGYHTEDEPWVSPVAIDSNCEPGTYKAEFTMGIEGKFSCQVAVFLDNFKDYEKEAANVH